MKTYNITIVLCVLILIGLTGLVGFSYKLGFNSALDKATIEIEEFTEDIATKTDIDKMLDANYLEGVKDGVHCVDAEMIQKKPVYADERCVKSRDRILKMEE